MPEAIAPVNATSTGTVPAPVAEPAAGDKPKRGAATSPMESKLSDVIGQINQKYGGDPNEFKSFGEITDEVQARESKPAQKAPPPVKEAKADFKPPVDKVPPPQEGEVPPPVEPKMTRVKVEGKEYELTPEQLTRFAQKGIHYEKKGVDISMKERQLQEKEHTIQQSEAQKQAFFDQLANDPGGTLEAIFGPQVFDKLKPWAAGKVQKEMEYEQNPHLKQIDDERMAREKTEAELQSYRDREKQQQIDQQSQQLERQFSETITKALQESGLPRTDFTAAEMAAHIERAGERGITYTPEQLAQIVKEDNTLRIRAMTDSLVQGITEARSSKDDATIVKLGQQAVEMFGEPVMYAISKYHLAQLRNRAPQQPRQILETPRVKTQESNKGWGENGKQYMSEEKYAEMRGKIARGEMEPPPGW